MTENLDIHRLLDGAFQGIPLTPETQDLKEEIRGNLVARVAELEASGHSASDAADTAISELGDVRELVGQEPNGEHAPESLGYAALQRQHRVRPRPGFVVRVVVWSIVAIVGVVVGILGATGVLALPIGPVIALFGVAATGLALVIGDSLSQETTTNHPMPELRASGYALATFLAAYGLGFAGLIALGALAIWVIVFAAVGVIASIVLFAFLGASQTNRRKAWVRRAQHAQDAANRFQEEPETAARFGIYTVVIWLVTLAVIVLSVFTVGWWWAVLAFVGGFAVMMLVLARMMFGPKERSRAVR